MVREDEERRARLFREQQRKQMAARRVRNAALRGNNATVKAIKDGWMPLILARREAGLTERDECDE